MGNKTSQLQIRITPGEKVVLKRLAAAAGLNVSQYVLSVVLPSPRDEFTGRATGLVAADNRARALSDLGQYLFELEPAALGQAVADADLDAVPPLLRNYVAACVELVSAARGTAMPAWTRRVAPLAQPHFARDLWSLHPHQLRVTPVTFKRRNVFVDVEAIDALNGSAPRVPPHASLGAMATALECLDEELAIAGVVAELCPVDEAVVTIAYTAAPATRRITALLQPVATVRAAASAVAMARGLPVDWLAGAASAALAVGPGGDAVPFVEMPNLRIFAAPTGYLLAARCAVMRFEVDPATLRDIRGLLRSLDVPSVEHGVRSAERYLARRDLPTGLDATLANLLAL